MTPGHNVDMPYRTANERLKKQLEKERSEILALQQRIQNFARLDVCRKARRDDEVLILPASPPEKAPSTLAVPFPADGTATQTRTGQQSVPTTHTSNTSHHSKTSIGAAAFPAEH